MSKGRSFLLTLAVLAFAATLTMSNVIGVLAPNPAETTPMESLSSPADGLTWTTTQVVSTESTGGSSDPSLAVGSDGSVHVAWWDETDYGGCGTDWDIFYKRWDPLFGWLTTQVVSTESTDLSYWPSLDVGPDGTVHVAWSDDTDYDGAGGIDSDVFYKKYVAGSGWTTTEVVSTESTRGSCRPSLAVGPDGTVHIAWDDATDYDMSGDDRDIFYKRWVPGTGWTTTEVVSTWGYSLYSLDPSLAVGPDGTVHIAWEQENTVPYYDPSDIYYRKWVPSTGWSTTQEVSTYSLTESFDPSLDVASDGSVHVAWYDEWTLGLPNQDVYYNRWDPFLGWMTQEVVSTETTEYAYYPSLAVGPDGTVHIAWREFTAYVPYVFDYDIYYKRWVPGTGWTTTEVVSTESTHGSSHPSLDVGPDGTIHVAWPDDTDYGGSGSDHDIVYKKGEKANVYLVVRGLNDRVYYRTCASGVWGGWKVVPTGATCDSPAAVVYAGELYMVVRGMDGKSLWFGWVDLADDSFSGWKWMSGSTPSKPTLTRWGSTLVLVVRGENNCVYYRGYSTFLDTWGDWNVVPTGTTCDSPAATVDVFSLHLVVRGETGHGLYYQSFSLIWPVYPGWTPISGDTPSAPTLTNNHRYNGDDHLLFLAVRGMNDEIYSRSWYGRWSRWSTLPDATIDAPGATVQPPHPRPDARIHLVVRGMTGGLYHGLFDLNNWVFLSWTLIDGDTPSPPTLTS